MFDSFFFGKRISTLRTLKNISQHTLTSELQVGNSAVSMMEHGQREASAEILIALTLGLF